MSHRGYKRILESVFSVKEASGEIFNISQFYSWEKGEGLKQVLIVLEFSTLRGPEASTRLQREKLLPIPNAPILFDIFLSCLVL